MLEKQCFLDSSTQNHAEPLWNYLKNSVSDLKLVKFNQLSEYWHVQHVPKAPSEAETLQKSMPLPFLKTKSSKWGRNPPETHSFSFFNQIKRVLFSTESAWVHCIFFCLKSTKSSDWGRNPPDKQHIFFCLKSTRSSDWGRNPPEKQHVSLNTVGTQLIILIKIACTVFLEEFAFIPSCDARRLILCLRKRCVFFLEGFALNRSFWY